jgi:hypothetical protein
MNSVYSQKKGKRFIYSLQYIVSNVIRVASTPFYLNKFDFHLLKMKSFLRPSEMLMRSRSDVKDSHLGLTFQRCRPEQGQVVTIISEGIGVCGGPGMGSGKVGSGGCSPRNGPLPLSLVSAALISTNTQTLIL